MKDHLDEIKHSIWRAQDLLQHLRFMTKKTKLGNTTAPAISAAYDELDDALLTMERLYSGMPVRNTLNGRPDEELDTLSLTPS